MANIKQKAIRKQEAAQHLINKGYYTESVHCIYYSCFLYMKYILHHLPAQKGCVTYKNQKIRGASSHNHILKLAKERIKCYKTQSIVDESFRYLKDKRNTADYSDQQLSFEDICLIKKKAYILKQILINTFGDL